MVFLLAGHLQHVALGDGRRTPMDNLDVEVDMIDLRKSTRTDAPSVDERVGEENVQPSLPPVGNRYPVRFCLITVPVLSKA